MTLNEFQQFLNIPTTNEYDEFTLAAIRNFQTKHSLNVTGTIDNLVIEKVNEINEGKLDTDKKLKLTEIKQYRLKSDEYFLTNQPKRSIFLHHTAGWSNPYNVVNDWERDQRGRIGTAYVVGGVDPVTCNAKYDGEILECMPPLKSYAWHLGIGNVSVHRDSVGIEVCNFGWVTKDSKGNFFTYPMPSKPNGIQVHPDNVIKLSKPFRGYEYWLKYTDEQVNSMEILIKQIGKQTGIDVTLGLQKRIKNLKDVYKAFDYDPDIVKNANGLYSHTNVSGPNKWGNFEKWDVSPQPALIEMILKL